MHRRVSRKCTTIIPKEVYSANTMRGIDIPNCSQSAHNRSNTGYTERMQRTIVTDTSFLSRPSISADPADPLDAAIAQDLKETLAAHREECVGMAANMIGEPKRVIAFVDEGLGSAITVMFNPQITAADGEYDACEGCLSLHGKRHTPRFRRIEVDYTTRKGRARHATFADWTAQIIQHEIDHCNGVLI
ncbi:peptide deformylase [Bifidobacterium animalis subsp. animalis MCC 0499]|nr:peptide deformylase [Bifidobacterium animalis subsp. animalis MCC 0499]